MKEEIKKFLGQKLKIEMDRQMGSAHPKHGWQYPINYGFVPGTINTDGDEIDAYLLGVNEPVAEYEGVCVAIIHRTNDDDDKLIVIPEGSPIPSDQEIREQTNFQEQYFKSEIYK